MSVVKIIELIGVSKNNWPEAAENALKEAHKTIRNITGIDVIGWTAEVEDGQITNYKANVKVAFIVERGQAN